MLRHNQFHFLRVTGFAALVAVGVMLASACSDEEIWLFGLATVVTADVINDDDDDESWYGVSYWSWYSYDDWDETVTVEVVYIREDHLYASPPGGQDLGRIGSLEFASSERTLTGGADADGFEFFLQDDAWVLVSVESLDGVNPFVQLYDATGELLAEDDDSGIDTDALLVGSMARGRYTAVVWSGDDRPHDGAYVVTILVGTYAGMDLEVIEVGDAVEIEDELLNEGQLERSTIFTLEESGTLHLEVLRSGELGADLELMLLDQAGNEVLAYAVAGDADLALSYELASEGSYMLVMRNMEDDGVARYDLRVALEE